MKIPEGWPTEEMQLAGAQVIRIDTTPINKIWTANKVFKAMIEAAPTPPAQEAEPVGDYLWREFMELCAKRKSHPADNNDLFSIIKRARAKYPEAPQSCNRELRAAAEEVVKISFEKDAIVNLQVFIQAVENLRAALEGK